MEKGNVLYIFTYLFSWISGLIVFVTEGQRDQRLKFHSLQAICLGIAATVIDMALFFMPFLGKFLAFLIWVYGMYIAIKAYNGQDVKAPFLGDCIANCSGYSAQQ